jgi:hypothetical protein
MRDNAIHDAADEYYRTLTTRYTELTAALRVRFTAYPKDSSGTCWLGDSQGERQPYPTWAAAAEARKAAILYALQQQAARDDTRR